MTDWSAESGTSVAQHVCGIVWAPALNLFVAVAITPGPFSVLTSPDGVTWSGTLASNGIDWDAVCWSDSLHLLVAVSNLNAYSVMTSPDGVTWTVNNDATLNAPWRSVCWSPAKNLFVASAIYGVGSMTSPDGLIWTKRSTANAGANVIWVPELNEFISTPSTGRNIKTSPDGITWTNHVNALQGAGISALVWAPEKNLFVGVSNGAYDGAWAQTSPNGLTWTLQAGMPGNSFNGWSDVKWNAALGLFAAAGGYGSNDGLPITSPDGVTWTLSATPTACLNSSWNSLASHPSGFFVAGSGFSANAASAFMKSVIPPPPPSFPVLKIPTGASCASLTPNGSVSTLFELLHGKRK